MKPITTTAQIEINAPPATVRSIFLDFARYPQWRAGWTIQPLDAAKDKMGPELKEGELLKVNMQGMAFRPSVIENTPERFVWEGNLYNLFYGRHFFDFAPSKKNPGGTTFIQTENFGGCLLVLAWPWRNKEFDMSNWHSFNEALKNEAEKSTSQI